MTPPKKPPRGERQNLATPLWLFRQIHARYWFTLDACAEKWNAKLQNFCTEQNSGLLHEWNDERVWCNPPYSDIKPWIEKAIEKTRPLTGVCPLVVFLVPVRTSQPWFHDALRAGARVEFLQFRVAFEYPPGSEERKQSPFEHSMLLIFERSLVKP